MKTLRMRQRYIGKKQHRDPETGFRLNGQVQIHALPPPARRGPFEVLIVVLWNRYLSLSSIGSGFDRAAGGKRVGTWEHAKHAAVERKRTEYYFQCGAGYKT